MKKIIAIIVLLALILAAYFGQVAYLGSAHHKLYQSLVEDNDFIRVENESFEKGFFTSSAKFTAFVSFPPHYYEPIVSQVIAQTPISVELRFKNNIFAHDEIQAIIANPFAQILAALGESSGMNVNLDDVFLDIKGGVTIFGKAYFDAKFGNVALSDAQSSAKIDNLTFGGEVDLEKELILALNFALNSLEITDSGPFQPINLSVNGIKWSEKYEKGVKFEDLMAGIYSAKNTGSIDKVRIYELNIDSIKTSNAGALRGEGEDAVMDGAADLSIGKIHSDIYHIDIEDFYLKLDYSDLSVLSLRMLQDYYASLGDINAPSPDEIALSFVLSKPKITMSDFHLSSRGKKFSANGEFSGSTQQMSSILKASSEVLPSVIVPFFAVFEIDKKFIEKDGKYEFEARYESDFNQTKFSINGEEINLFANEGGTDMDGSVEMPFFDDEIAPVVTPNLPK